MTAPGPVWITGKVIEKNSAGIAVEFPVSEFSGYKVVIPAGTPLAVDGEPGDPPDVGEQVQVAGELLSIVDTRNEEKGLGSVAAHVKIGDIDFYVDPDQAALESIGA